MAYLEVKIPANAALPTGQPSVSVTAQVRFMASNGQPDTVNTGIVDLFSMNPDFCDVNETTVLVPRGGVGRATLVCTPIIPQKYPDGNWYCDVMVSAQTPDGTIMGGSPAMHIQVPAPPQPTTKQVSITGNGVTKSSNVPVPVRIAVDGVEVYNSEGFSNPIENNWGAW